MIRNSSKDLESRELPVGARRSEKNYELTFEQPAEGNEGLFLCRFGRSFRRKREEAC